jgi:hypothetical protein
MAKKRLSPEPPADWILACRNCEEEHLKVMAFEEEIRKELAFREIYDGLIAERKNY